MKTYFKIFIGSPKNVEKKINIFLSNFEEKDSLFLNNFKQIFHQETIEGVIESTLIITIQYQAKNNYE